jgi:osmotically-inducible protein OsmY
MSISRTAKIIAATLMISSLSSCIPAALVVGATAGGAVIYDKRSMSTIVQDRDSEQGATNVLSAAPELQKGTHISVATFHHILLLVGQTSTEEQRDIANRLVTNIKYVSRVYNQITVRKPISLAQRSSDAWITTKIKTEMLAKPGLQSTEIKVVTEDGVVYLMGILTPKQVEMAVDLTRRVDGVREVVKVFENEQ